MKCATRRPTTNKGEQHNHAYFDTWKDCVIDYAFFSAQYLDDIKTEKEYFEYLSQNYAEDTTYISKLKKIIEKKELKNILK
jgi:flagellum-specific peptidoglycan hydrolase FlgJ